MKIESIVWCTQPCHTPDSAIISWQTNESGPFSFCQIEDDETNYYSKCEQLQILYKAWKEGIQADYLCMQEETVYFSHSTEAVSGMQYPCASQEALNHLVSWDDEILPPWSSFGQAIVPAPVDTRHMGFDTVLDYFTATTCLPQSAITEMKKVLECHATESLYYLNQSLLYPHQIFGFPQDILRQYVQWLFPLLEKIYHNMDTTHFSKEQHKAMLYFSNLLFGAFVHTHFSNQTAIGKKMFYCKWIQFEKSAPIFNYMPAFCTNNIAVTLSSSDYFAPYAAATIQSILDHASPENNYDIFILSKDMTEKNKVSFAAMVKEEGNVSIRIIDVSSLIPAQPLREEHHFTIESYFRMMLAYVLPNHDKVVHCDCDLIWQKDIAELYRIDIGDSLMGAVIDPIYAGLIYQNDFWKNYNTSILHIEKDMPYYNTGVMILNLSLFRRLYSFPYVLHQASIGNYVFCDQDLLNVLCADKIFTISQKWNVVAGATQGNLDTIKMGRKDIYKEYLLAQDTPYVIHYADKNKPWKQESCRKGYVFWETARKTPFYEQILFRMSHDILQEAAKDRGYRSFAKETVV